MFYSKNDLESSGIGLFFLSNELPISELNFRLERLLQQSIDFSEIHLISSGEYVQADTLINRYNKIQIHVIGNKDGELAENFYNILSNSQCSQVLLTNGTIIGDTRYSLEHFCLQARLSEKVIAINEDTPFDAKQKTGGGLFGKLDNFIFSREWLLIQNVLLTGLSENDQTLFIAESIAAAGEHNTFSDIINNSQFTERAKDWAMSLTQCSFPSGILLCKKLFEVADKRNFSEVALAAEILCENLTRVCGRFVSPYEKTTKESQQLHSLLEKLAETIRTRSDICDAVGLSEEITSALARPLVSVIVPVYNSEKEVQRCLSSIFSQTLKSIEVICVNDGSEDRSLEILREVEANHQNCLVMTQKNYGQATARNRAISVANGKYLGFVDSDDWIEPCMFETMAIALEQHPEAQLAKCGAYCDYDYIVTESERRAMESYYSESEPEGVYPVGPDRLLTGVVWDKLYKASLIKDNDIKFPEGVKNEDEAFALFTVCRTKYYILLKEKFYHYIRTSSGTMSKQAQLPSSGRIPDVFDICNLMLDFLFREKKYSYVGRVLKTILGAAERFKGSRIDDEINHAVSTLLNKAEFGLYMYTIVPEKRAWCNRQAAKYLNLYYPEPFIFKDLSMWLPSESEIHAEAINIEPQITFIVPVYNVQKFLIPTIESLRSQSMRNIEILCIDDGSTDCSLEILEHYQQTDCRIRVLTQVNSGVSATRNRGIKEARGEYIAFVDGDDYILPEMAEMCLDAAISCSLDVVAFDYCCFDCKSGKAIDHYWTINNRKSQLPLGQIFNAEAFRNRPFAFYGSSCVFLWRASFLREKELLFPPIKISEDLCFIINALSEARRIMILPEVFYYYRRNVPESAITSLKKTSSSDPRIETINEMCRTIDFVDRKSLSINAKANIIGRLLSEMQFFSKQSEGLKRYVELVVCTKRGILNSYSPMLCDNGVKKWMEDIWCSTGAGKYEKVTQQAEASLPVLDTAISILWSVLEKKRRVNKHDLIVVISFLGSEYADPVDSWTFFSWLQENDIPSCFVTNSNSVFYHNLVKQKRIKDVIALSKSCLQDNHSAYFLKKLLVPLSRAKAVVFEDFVWPWPLRERFKRADWKLVFLQHGVSYFKMSRKIKGFFTRFNLCNVSSLAEKEFLSREIGSYETDGAPYPKYIVAGFPRWDRLVPITNYEQKEPAIFIMFTWRDTFEDPTYQIRESSYFNGITSLIKSPILNELKNQGIKVIFAPHHHLLDVAPEIVREWPVELCQQQDISYWVKNASCLITDYSSISWDFMFQKKPVIHWVLDQMDFSLGEEILSQLEFAYKQVSELSCPVHSIYELENRLRKYADNGFKATEEDIKRAERFFPYRDGFSQRVYEKLCCDSEQKGTKN